MENYSATCKLIPSKVEKMVSFHVDITRNDEINGVTKVIKVWSGDFHRGSGCVRPVYKLYGTSGVDKYATRLRIESAMAGEKAALQFTEMPKVKDVLYNIVRDADCDMSFDDWCSNLGYSNDSISAKQIYEACQKTRYQLINSIGKDEIERLTKLFEGY